MPELPEVEVVRRGLERHLVGRTVASVDVIEPRSIRRHEAGAADFAAQLTGFRITGVERRGKFMWVTSAPQSTTPRASRDDSNSALVVHLGMSGQVLIDQGHVAPERHSRIVLRFARPAMTVRFDDQRMFGGMMLDELCIGDDGRAVPKSAAHIAADPFEAVFDADAVAQRVCIRSAGIKSLLLNQSLISGIGNIYADEALWRARVHWRTPGNEVSRRRVLSLLNHARDVMAEALDQGGTSFDSLYVNVNGQSGYFSRSLNAYGQEGSPCQRCGSLIRREPFANRSSYRCPRCQRGS